MVFFLGNHALEIRDFGRTTKEWGLASGRSARYGLGAGLALSSAGFPEIGIPLAAKSTIYGSAAKGLTIFGLGIEEFGNELLRK